MRWATYLVSAGPFEQLGFQRVSSSLEGTKELFADEQTRPFPSHTKYLQNSWEGRLKC